MRVSRNFVVVQTGIGRPDYSEEVALGQVRPGLSLKNGQSLIVGGISFTAIPSPYSWVTTPLPPNGTHTAAVNLTVMTDAAANFRVNALVGMTINNVTDGSSGMIIANTVNTVTVATLTGGITNRWNTNDVYSILAHIIDWETGLPFPYSLSAGIVYTIISMSRSANQDSVLRAYLSTPARGIPLSFVGNLGMVEAGYPHWLAEVVPFSTQLFDPTAAYSHQIDFIVENLGGAALEGSFTGYGIMEAIGTPERPSNKTVRCKFCGYEWVVPRSTTYINCPKCGQLNIYVDLSGIRSIG